MGTSSLNADGLTKLMYPGTDNEEDRRIEMSRRRGVCRVHNRDVAQRQERSRGPDRAGALPGETVCRIYSLVS